MFWKFQAKFFKNTCDWAYFLKVTSFWDAILLTMNSASKYFQGFFLDYQNTLFPEQLFIAHSCGRVPNTLYVMNPLYSLPHLLKVSSTPSSLEPPTFTSTSILDVLFLWLYGWSCIWCVILLNDIMDLSSFGTLVPERSCYILCNNVSGLVRSDT